jgi:hypothetical protein
VGAIVWGGGHAGSREIDWGRLNVGDDEVERDVAAPVQRVQVIVAVPASSGARAGVTTPASFMAGTPGSVGLAMTATATYHNYDRLEPSPQVQDLVDYLDTRADPIVRG